MREFKIPNNTSALKNHPKIAELVGIYISTFSVLEIECLKVFSLITGASESVGHIILHQFASISHRLQVLSELADGMSDDNKIKKTCQEIVARIIKANSFRNHIAHSIYAIDINDDTKLHYVMNAARKRPKTDARRLVVSEIESEIANVENLLKEIDQLYAPLAQARDKSQGST